LQIGEAAVRRLFLILLRNNHDLLAGRVI
jgi:hypothetical protein